MWLSRCQSSRRTSKAGNPAPTKQSQSPRLASADCHGVNSSNHIALSCQQLSQSPWLLWTVWSHAPWPQHATPGMHFLRCLQTVTPLSRTPAPNPNSTGSELSQSWMTWELWLVPSGLIWTAQSWPQARRLGPGGCRRRPGGRLPGATVPPNGPGSVETVGPWVGSVLPPPFCFCIRGKLFFLGYICTSQIRNVLTRWDRWQPATTAQNLFFFFPFLSETSRKRKVNDMSVGLMHTASSAPHTQMEQSRERAQTVSSGGKPAFPAVTGLGARWSGLGAVGVKRR